jgi:hypothetical protein
MFVKNMDSIFKQSFKNLISLVPSNSFAQMTAENLATFPH